MEVYLDTSFIVSCIRKKIDFISELEDLGFKIILPREVFQEMKGLRKDSKQSHADRMAIDLAFKMFEKTKIKKTTLGGRIERRVKVDEALISKGKEGFYIATLDNGIKRNVPNKVIISNAKNSVMVERT